MKERVGGWRSESIEEHQTQQKSEWESDTIEREGVRGQKRERDLLAIVYGASKHLIMQMFVGFVLNLSTICRIQSAKYKYTMKIA